jgi:hypothetical protein
VRAAQKVLSLNAYLCKAPATTKYIRNLAAPGVTQDTERTPTAAGCTRIAGGRLAPFDPERVVAGLPKPGQDGVGGGHQCLRSTLRPALGITRLGYQSSGPIAPHPAAELVPIDAVVFPAAMTDAPINDFDRSQRWVRLSRVSWPVWFEPRSQTGFQLIFAAALMRSCSAGVNQRFQTNTATKPATIRATAANRKYSVGVTVYLDELAPSSIGPKGAC